MLHHSITKDGNRNINYIYYFPKRQGKDKIMTTNLVLGSFHILKLLGSFHNSQSVAGC